MEPDTCICRAHAEALERLAGALMAAHEKGNHVTAGSFSPDLALEPEEADE